jgi:hypothetical protein
MQDKKKREKRINKKEHDFREIWVPLNISTYE